MLSVSLQDHSWSRRCSTETVYSIQGKETDYARDTSDTELPASGDSDAESDVEYEPVSEPEEEDAPVDDDTSAQSDNDIITTKVIQVSVLDDGELQFADSERTDTYVSDSDNDLYDYGHCAQCRAQNNNPLYRYCQKCFQVRKKFFPPRPKRKKNKKMTITRDQDTIDEIPRTFSQDSGVCSAMSQDSQENPGEGTSIKSDNYVSRCKKRRADYVEREAKRKRISHTDSDTDLSSDDSKSQVKPLEKTVSDPGISVDNVDVKITKKVIANTLIETMNAKDLCVICISEPKSGVFVHGRIAHICCCYKCAVKVWAKAKRCPVCNCKVSNVLKAVVM